MIGARDRWLLGAFVLSGAAGLGYELLWTRLLALALGSETLGVLGVLAGFFGGMALGAAALHGRARRSPDPVALFVRLELVAAAFAVVSPWWLHALASWLPAALGPTSGLQGEGPALALTIGAAGIVLLPGTFCMGATLPALVEARRRSCTDDADGRGLGRLYAANTVGAVLGVLGTVHLLLPMVGMIGGSIVLAALGVGAAVVARRWGQHHQVPAEPAPADDRSTTVDASRDPDAEIAREPWLLLALLLGTGLAGVGLEVVAVQILSQVLENTIFTFAHVLAVYLLGTAAGAALYTRYAARAVAGRPATVAAGLLLAHAIATVWAGWALGRSPWLLDDLAGTGAGFGAQMLAEGLVAALVLGPATMLMGALFSHVAGLLAPRGIGRAYALNTFGGALAPFAFGVGAIESMGYRDALFAVVYTYLVLFGAFTWFRRFKPALQIGAILGVVALTTTAPSSLLLVTQSPRWEQTAADWKVLDTRETLLGAVVVSEFEPEGRARPGPPLRRLQVGQEFRMGGALAFGERRMGQIPLLLHPEPRRALFLGVGTGATLGAVEDHPSLTHVDAVELVPAVLEQLHHFSAINGDVARDERVHLHAADARRFVAASVERYDVIVADLFHPGRDGAGNLYSREHFENIEQRLADDGLFAQWLPLYQLDPRTLRVIVRTFVDVFGEAHALLGIYNVETPAIVLVGRSDARAPGPLVVDVDRLSARLDAPVYRELLMDPRDLLGAYLLDAPGLRALCGPGPLNTDLSPWVSVQAPRAAYEESRTRGRDNLMELLAARVPVPPSALVAADPAALERFRAEVAAFAEALGHYLRAESTRLDTLERVPGLVAAVDEYLAAYDVAPQFRPARGMLLESTTAAPDLAERIFPAMLERTPKERLVWQAYVAYLQRNGDPRLEAAMQDARRELGLPDAASP
ncbi:MAG: hypothetical protein KDK70_00835 [Myxococcales bacterium]|nr:hypothetical protein [Myxococcales bacterium]